MTAIRRPSACCRTAWAASRPNTLNTRIKELREAGLLGHGQDGYCVTPAGADLLKRLADLPAFAAKWVAVQGKKKADRHTMSQLHTHLDPAVALPQDANQAVLVGRAWVHGQGAVLVRVTPDGVLDLSRLAPTMQPAARAARSGRRRARVRRPAPSAATAAVLANSARDVRAQQLPWLLAPCDLQAIKAAGVTFVASMLERVIEEQARGDASRAESVRAGRGGRDRRQPVGRASPARPRRCS